MNKPLRTVFIILMLVCAGILIWHVPASTLVNRAIDDARDDLSHEQALLRKQIEEDHAKWLNQIHDYQLELDALLTPELDELWRHELTIKKLKSEKSELQSEIKTKESEKKSLLKMLQDPETEEGSYDASRSE